MTGTLKTRVGPFVVMGMHGVNGRCVVVGADDSLRWCPSLLSALYTAQALARRSDGA